MKKQLLSHCTILLFSISLIAQPEKKDLLIGSSLSAIYNDNKTEKLRTSANGGMNITPMVGVCIGKGYVFGGGISYANAFNTAYDNQGDKTMRSSVHSVGIFAFSRDYKRIADKFYTRAGTNIGYTVSMQRDKFFPSGKKSNLELTHSFDIRFRMGLVYFPKPNVGIEFSYGEIGYNLEMQHIVSGHPKSVSNHFNLKYGIDGIQVGLVVLMKPRKKSEEKK